MKKADWVRSEVIRIIGKAKSGHIAGPVGMADVFTVLYYEFLNINPKKPLDKDRDYLVLSNGHICPVQYVVLADKGFFPKKELEKVRKLNNKLQGHPHRGTVPGLETTSGPLGSGLSQAAGMALGLKRDNKTNRVVCITSDGEHQEGNNWEAVLFCNKYKLDNLIQIVDRNNIQIDGNTEEIMPLGNLKSKYESFGWKAIEIEGNNIDQIRSALSEADNHKGSPVVIIANTIPGKGVSFMEHDYKWHGKPPSKEEAEKAMSELKWD